MSKGWYDVSMLKRFPELVAKSGVTLTEKAEDIRTRNFRDGKQAPPWDPQRRRKYWADPVYEGSASKELQSYKIFENGEMISISMTKAEAGSLNLPGAYAYPTWIQPHTAATSDGQVMGPNSLSTQKQATELAVELGLEMAENTDHRVSWNGEVRRMYQVKFKGSWVNVGLLLEQRNSEGVGSPGRWDLTGDRMVWLPEPRTDNGVYDPRPSVPVPCRNLYDYEVIKLAGGPVKSWVIVDTRVESEYNPAVAVPGNAADPEIKVILTQILDAVTSLNRFVRGEQA